MPYINSITAQRIRELANQDIIELIGEHISIQKKGKDFKAICPFHDDTTPSLSISESRQIFKCFVCGEGGDAVHFLIEHTGKSYHDVLVDLAERYHIPFDQPDLQNYTAPADIPGLNEIKPLIRKLNKVYLTMEPDPTNKAQPWLQINHPLKAKQAAALSKLCTDIYVQYMNPKDPDFLQTIAELLAADQEQLINVMLIRSFKFKSISDNNYWLTVLINELPGTADSERVIINLLSAIPNQINRSTHKQHFFDLWDKKIQNVTNS